MTVNELFKMIFRGDVSPVETSRKLGRSDAYISATMSRDLDTTSDNLATILDAADYDLLARHRSSGKEYVITPRK